MSYLNPSNKDSPRRTQGPQRNYDDAFASRFFGILMVQRRAPASARCLSVCPLTILQREYLKLGSFEISATAYNRRLECFDRCEHPDSRHPVDVSHRPFV